MMLRTRALLVVAVLCALGFVAAQGPFYLTGVGDPSLPLSLFPPSQRCVLLLWQTIRDRSNTGVSGFGTAVTASTADVGTCLRAGEVQ